MCISAQASFTVAAGLVTVGAFALNKAQSAPMKVFAMTPLLFAAQQALEGIVWLSLGTTQSPIHTVSMYCFLLFAFCVWPLWIPYALYGIEKNPMRKKLLAFCGFVGALVAGVSLLALLLYGATATVAQGHIHYAMPVGGVFATSAFATLHMPLYLCATVLPLFIASTWRVWLIGTVIAVGYFVANTWYAVAFASLWCFIAAVASVLVYRVVTKHNEEVLL